jgi:peptidyl-prolyl cis-trans isomerase D
MFEFVRTHNRLLFFVLVLLIFPSFVFFGVQGYSRFDDPSNQPVARVDGQKITRAEWDAAHRRQVEQARARMPNLDPKFFDLPEARRETLDQLVRERVLLSASARGHLSASDERLMRELTAIPQLAALKRADGSFDIEAYKAMLQAQGRSAESFEAGLRQEIALRQVTSAIADTGPAAAAPARMALDALLQQREVQVLRFDVKDHAGGPAPTDAELAAFHKANEAQFRTPEQASIEYVVLDLATLEKGIPAPEAELRKYYDENLKTRYTTAEERRASHLLVAAAKDATAELRAKAKARAEQLLVEARKNPAAFAELARKNSDDTASAPQGGDLEFNGRGGFVAKSLEDAVFSMKEGEIGNLVESEFGYHVVRLDATRGGVAKSYESVRAEIEAELKKQGAMKEFAAAADQFGNLVNAQADSLAPVADKLKLTRQTATVQRSPQPGASGALASAKLLEAVFASDAIAKKLNTEAIEIGPNQLVSARVLQHMPSRVQPLAEVQAQVRERVAAEQAAARAKKAGQDRLAQLQATDSTAGLPASVTISRADPQALPRQVVEAVLRADAAKLPQWLGVDLGAAGYALARLAAVRPPAADAPQVTQLLPRYAQAFSAAEAQAYYKALERRFKVSIEPAALAAEAAASAAAN